MKNLSQVCKHKEFEIVQLLNDRALFGLKFKGNPQGNGTLRQVKSWMKKGVVKEYGENLDFAYKFMFIV